MRLLKKDLRRSKKVTLRKTNNPRFSTVYRKLSLEERFKLSYMRKSGPLETDCWIWFGHTNSNPKPYLRYGTMVKNRKRILAHRFSWEQFNHSLIPKKGCICHKCDIPLCVNPDHLFLGDRIINTADREQKGRGPQGERNWCTKLKEVDIPKIRALNRNGVSQREIADLFNVKTPTISSVVTNRSWKHVK